MNTKIRPFSIMLNNTFLNGASYDSEKILES